MTWLITGGTGQLGTALSRELDILGISFEAPSSSELDITQGTTVNNVIMNLCPKVIVNCAAWTNVDEAETQELMAMRVNRIGAENIATAAKMCGAKLVQISTDYVFSGLGYIPWKVNSRKSPRTVYGRTKAEGENKVLELYPENSFILRTAWLYSPWGRNFAKTMIGLAHYTDRDVYVVNDQVGQPTSAIDLARQLINLTEFNLPPGIYHGTNSGSATWFQSAQTLCGRAGAEVSRVVPVDSNRYPRTASRPRFSVLDHKEWLQTSLREMKDWKLALDESFPGVLEAVLKEGGEFA